MLQIGILALENCIYSTVLGSFDIFSIARQISIGDGNSRFAAPFIITQKKDGIQSFNHLTINSDRSLSDKNIYDIIIIPAIYGDTDALCNDTHLIKWIKQQHANGACICTVCAGAFIAAKAGILSGKEATTHWALAESFKENFQGVTLKPESMLIDVGDVISSGGVTAYLDLCLYILKRFGSFELASTISKTLLIDCSRQTQTPYSSYIFRKNHGDKQIMKAQKWLEEKYHQPVVIPELAKIAGLGERTFNRKFKEATGDTPIAYLQGLRIETARKILETTSESIEDITTLVGYDNTSSFRRLFKHQTGLTPSEYRKRFSNFQA